MLGKEIHAGNKSRVRVIFLCAEVFVLGMVFFIYWRQRYVAHEEESYQPEYAMEILTQNADKDTFFRQTGLGGETVDKLLEAGEFDRVVEIQQAFFMPRQVECTSILGWFTREDRIGQDVMGPDFADLQPGDILLTLCTHSAGWRHGHAALVMDDDTTLECMLVGTDSAYGNPQNWRKYAGYCVLRIKGITAKEQEAAVSYAVSNLYGVPYHLSAGFLGPKAPEPDAALFGLHCTYLVWYVWYQFGYDLDSDGGRLVSANDLLRSDLLEVVQMYGMNPEEFIEN